MVETGFNSTAWRERARMLWSLEVLAAGQPVTAAALYLSYAMASAFIGMFGGRSANTGSVSAKSLNNDDLVGVHGISALSTSN